MPQLDLSTYPSQLFWLGISFLLLYITLNRYVLPRMGEVFQSRTKRIESALNRASSFKEEVYAIEAEMSQKLDTAREEARKMVESALIETGDLLSEKRREFHHVFLEREKVAEKKTQEGYESALKDMKSIAHGLTLAITSRFLDTPPTDTLIDTSVQEALAQQTDKKKHA
ncbi:MAG: hypothetical protein HOI80_01075 [Alphaproteobacteria bacterium]|nr:hypothetical protein [Alphaproteobacteria bacterium]MBT5390650.1 hypothetical protein [Alphaproteobacteria bacterium]MBT5540254.1 hypothetical protein [Alphaproteobacteria bacterium]MBT5654078.1 hypothetical protein [Alphaproteobacteria bacterium]